MRCMYMCKFMYAYLNENKNHLWERRVNEKIIYTFIYIYMINKTNKKSKRLQLQERLEKLGLRTLQERRGD